MTSQAKILPLILCACLCTSLEVLPAEEATVEISQTDTSKQSLIKAYPETFSRGHILVLNSISDPESTQVKLFNPDCAEVHAFNCAKERGCAECGKWDDRAKVTRETNRVYGSGVKIDKKYKGHRKHFIGLVLQDLLAVVNEYKGTILIDQYKQYPLWNVILKCRNELNKFLDYLQRNLEAKGKKTFDRKPIILLNLKEDPYLETLEIEDIARLKSYFEVVDYSDNNTVEFFRNAQITMDEIVINFEAGHPHYVGENMRERIIRELESWFSEFELTKMMPKFGLYAAGVLSTTYLSSYIFPPILKSIFGNKPA